MRNIRLHWRIASLVMIVALAIFGAMSFNSTASAKTTNNQLTISSSHDHIQPAAKTAWTKAQMLAAKDYPVATTSQPVTVHPSITGTPGSIAPKMPTIKAPASSGISPDSFTIPPSAYSSFPYSAVGKLFFNQNGGSFVCSASLVKGHGIWTAGHCAHAGNNSPNGWSTNAIFVPQYFEGSAPLGLCFVTQWTTTTAWYANGNPGGLDHDYAGGSVSCDISNITSFTGFLGTAWNFDYSQTWQAIGYPQAPPFDGGQQIECDGTLAAFGFGSPTTQGIVCDMTGGSSGGPWLISGVYVNGNVSYSDSRFPGLLFSPHYDTLVNTIWNMLAS
jgi:V8-like Glu-specific endopeptidase